MTQEDALWAAVGATPDDALPRLVLADWLEENAGMIHCPHCGGGRDGEWFFPVNDAGRCDTCDGENFIPDGRADLAAALRATADRAPWPPESGKKGQHLWVNDYWMTGWDRIPNTARLDRVLFAKLQRHKRLNTVAIPTAEVAIRDLCRAWVAVHRTSEVPA